MKTLFGVWVVAVAALGPVLAHGAEPAQPPAVEPDYVAPAASLAPERVQDMQRRLLDWPGLARYREDNARLPPREPGRVVFYGDSITDGWGRVPGTAFFPGKPYVNRGISGQTTAQMLVRFRQDVIALHPEAVVILAGTNDIAGNTGPATQGMIEDNLRSMTQLAQANGIRVVLASVLPASEYPWRPGYRPAGRIRALNRWIEQYAHASGAVYLDYHTAMANAEGGLDARLADDGVHPTPAGYEAMAPLAQQAVDAALVRE
ncbi:SGNH/GDSL hydrolase family protein [Pseudoxanthomonas putridarboris]|uniref:SGNH/GDSL hydrolase family protein n=1 Tax=Pseudoxanthomonas putridarboris TaxID=752605 RepID=A0ABU9J5H9_9GAMM